MQRDSDKYRDLNVRGRETGEFTGINVNYGAATMLTEMQTLSDRRYQVLFETMTQGVICQDTDGRIIMANPVAQEILGYSLQELQGCAFQDLMHVEQGETLDEEQMPLHRILSGEVITSAQAVDVVIQTCGGSDRSISISGSPLRDETGRMVGTIAVIPDVTEQRVLERRTQRALDALLSMAEALVQDTQ